MFSIQRWRKLLLTSPCTAKPVARRYHRANRPGVEILEDRLVPATWSGDIFDTAPGVPLWTNGSVQEVIGDVHVPAGKTLTIQPGTVVKFDGGKSLKVDGTLSAPGTAAQPIIVTSISDNSPSGGSNTAHAGDWNQILFTASSTGSVLDNTVVRYGGNSGSGDYAEVEANGTSPTFRNCTFNDGLQYGLRLIGSNAVLTGDTFQRNGIYTQAPGSLAAIRIDLASQPVVTGTTTMTNNNRNAVQVDPGTLPAGTITWANPGVVYLLPQTVTVPAGVTLVVGAGQVVKMQHSLVVQGTLTTQGTDAQPVVFTSVSDDAAGGDTNNDNSATSPRPGEWSQILFASSSTGSVLDHTIVRYGGNSGGSSSFNYAEVEADGTSPTISNSTLSDSLEFGLRLIGSNAVLTGDTFQRNGLTQSFGFGGPVHMNAASQPVITGTTFTNNNLDTLAVDGTAGAGTTTWNNTSFVYLLVGTVTVPQGGTLVIAPGQVIKPLSRTTGVQSFAQVEVNGTLVAQGTAANPVVITSAADDSVGGDTNKDGPSTGGAGNWAGILFTASSTGNVLDHVVMKDGSDTGGGTFGMIGVAGGTVAISNSVLGYSGHMAVFAGTGSHVTLTSSFVVGDTFNGIQAEAGSTVTVVNCTIDGNNTRGADQVAGVVLDSPTATLTNNLITNNGPINILQTGPTNLTMSFNDVFNPFGSGYSGLTDQTGTNGNLSVDPKYTDRAGGNYALKAGSPVEDAGTSANAPPTDSLGNPRYDDPNVTGRGDGSGYDMGAIEVQGAAVSHIDLATASVSGPATGLEGQSVTVTWSVQNVGTDPATGPWHDAVYLSADPVFTPDDLFLGDVAHAGNLAAGASYAGTSTFTLPGVTPGNYYFLVRANSRNEVFEGAKLGNNASAAAAPVAMDVPALTLGTPRSDSLATTGAAKLYKVTTAAGGNLSVTLTGPAGSTNELYVSFGQAPTRQGFDARGVQPGAGNQSVSISGTQAGTYYVLVYGANVPSGESFTLTAATPGFSIAGVSPAQGSNTGQVTLAITGAQFDATSQPQLVDAGGTTILPLHVYYTDPGHLAATFDLTGHPTGAATVKVVNGGTTATLQGGFTVVAGNPGRLVTSVTSPASIRTGQGFVVYVQVSNQGGADIPTPLLTLSDSGIAALSFTPDFLNTATELDLVGTSESGPAGVLAPGTSRSIPIYATITTAGTEQFSLTIGTSTGPIDYVTIGPTIRPPALSDADWNALYAQLQTQLGSDWGSYTGRIGQDAALLPAAQGLNYSLDDDFALEVQRARTVLTPSVTGRLFLGDTAHPLAGVHVSMTDPSTSISTDGYSLSDGTFLMAGVQPGTYDVTFDGYVSATPVQLAVGASGMSGVNLVVSHGASIAGSVAASATGAPAVDLAVVATDAHGNTYSTQTDASGNYRLDSLPAGDYTVRVPSGGGLTTAMAAVAGLAAGELRTHVNLTPNPGGSVQGTVVGASGPLAGATVSALAADGTGASTTTGTDGSFTLAGLGAGTYSVVAFSAGLVTQGVAGVSVVAGQTAAGVTVHLSATAGSLQGTLTQPDGSPAAFVVLSLTSGAATYTAQADSQGDYTVADLQPGAYTVTVNDAGFMTMTAPAAVTAGAAATLNLTLTPRGTVAGHVVNATGAAVGGVQVVVENADGAVGNTVTAADGGYQVTGLDAGSYTVLLGDPGTPGLARATAALDPAHATATTNFTLALTATVSGTVFLADGTTADPAGFVVLSQGGQPILSAPVDATGHYSFDLVTAGTYQIEAGDQNLTFPARSVVLTAGTILTGQNFQPGTRTLTGVVTSGAGAPAVGASVTVIHTGTGLVVTDVGDLTTDASGAFQLAGLIDGSYVVRVAAPGFASATRPVTVAGGNPSPLSVPLGAESTLTGTVRDAATGTGVAGATVYLMDATAATVAFATADSSGAYQLGGVAAGSYTVLVLADNHETLTQPVTLGSGAQTTNLTVQPAAIQVQGHVMSGSMPLEYATVVAVNAAGLVAARAQTGSDGSYTLSTLAPGSYTVKVVAGGYAPVSPQAVQVTQGQTLSGVDFTGQTVALSDPPPGGGSGGGGVGDILGLVDSLLRTADHLPREPHIADLNGKIDLKDCPEQSADAIRLVEQIPDLFEAWAAAQSDLRWSAGTEAVSLSLQVADTVGKFISIVKSLAFSATTSSLTAVQQLGIRFVPPLLQAAAGIANAIHLNQAGDSVAERLENALGVIRDNAGSIATILGDLLKDAEKAASFADLGDFLGKISAVTAAKSTIDDAIKGFTELMDRFISVANAKARYSDTVAHANAAISFLDDCRGDHPGEPVPIKDKGGNKGNGGSSSTNGGTPKDPNDLIGPAAFGPQGFIQPGTFPFRVDFENDPTATAAAQVVSAAMTLNSNLDPASFQFTGFGFGSRVFNLPAGLTHYQTTIDLRASGKSLLVPVTLDENPVTGAVSVSFQSLDPTTMLSPAGANAGFLPIDNAAGDGQGYFTYSVRPKAGRPTGTQIRSVASIVFDTNAAIATDQVDDHDPSKGTDPAKEAPLTIDVTAPTSSIAALAATQSAASFTVNWSGTDAGSGVAFYSVYVSDNGGAFVPFRLATTATSAVFTGSAGHTYSFYSVATDHVGLVQPTPTSAQATTFVSPPIVPPPPPPGTPVLVGYPRFAVGADVGGPSVVNVYNPNGSVATTLNPFPGTTGGVRTAVADFNGDGTPDVVVGTGPGAVAEVKVIDGKTGAVLFDVMPFETFTGGVFVAAGDMTKDGNAELVITPDLSGGPRVEVYHGGDFKLLANFFGIDDPNFRGGARATLGDLNFDGRADLVVSAGFGGGPRIAVYDGFDVSLGDPHHLVPDFFLFEQTLRNGAYVAVGDVDGDGWGDIVGGGGPGGGPRVLVISGKTLLFPGGSQAALNAPIANFFAGDVNNRGGIRVTVKDLDGDDHADVVVGAGTGAGSTVTAYLGMDLAAGSTSEDLSIDAVHGFTGGVFVG